MGADLRLEIRHRVEERGTRLEYQLSAYRVPGVPTVRNYGPVSLRKDPESYFSSVLRDLKGLCDQAARGSRRAADDLYDKGVALGEQLLTDELRTDLAKLADRARTLELMSDEPWIPWELLCIREQPGEPEGESPFLAEAFSLVRWLPNRTPSVELPLRQLAVVVAEDARLPMAAKELRDLLSRKGAGRSVDRIPALYAEVRQGLEQGNYDGWHFTCHGSASGGAPEDWRLTLENQEYLKPQNLNRAFRGAPRPPLVFLNACETGQGGFELTRTGGWAHRFLKQGAGAFVGPLWSIRDRWALAFARAFYDRFLAGEPLAQAVLGARLELREQNPGDPHRLAYVVYGDAAAVCGAGEVERPEAVAGDRIGRDPGEPGPDRTSRPRADPGAGGTAADRAVTRSGGGEAAPPASTSPVSTPPVRPAEPAPGTEREHPADGTVLLYVPGGQYPLGAEDAGDWARPVHWVQLSPFWIARFPVTNAQYRRFLEANPEHPRPPFLDQEPFADPEQPVVGVSWGDARAYCRWAGLQLPTEAQWEAAARGQDRRTYPWGDEPPTPDHANFGGDVGRPTPGGTYPAGRGPFGTWDQAGNVWEWCLDGFSRTAYRDRGDGRLDPVSPARTDTCAVRGGSWQNLQSELRAAYREYGGANVRFNIQGFRCAWMPDGD